MKKRSAQDEASHALQRPECAQRLAYLREKSQNTLAVRHEFKREDAIDWLVSILQTPLAQIDENHPLCEGKRSGRNGTTYWMPSKLAAMELLARMMPGWLVPTRAEFGATPEAVEMLKALRNGEELPEPIDITPSNDQE